MKAAFLAYVMLTLPLAGCSLADIEQNGYRTVERALLPAPNGPVTLTVLVSDEEGEVYQPRPQVWWSSTRTGASDDYAAQCADVECTRWEITGATSGPLYVGASHREETRGHPYCFRETSAVATVESVGAETDTVALTLGDYDTACE